MDDLYEDLDNYNYLKELEELRKENRELKIKNEEFTAEIKRMQKDLDNVNEKYKILQSNYSSLFKTAKAEIERKSQIITNLNAEKDKLVLASIQNSDRSYAILKRSLANRASEKFNNKKGKKDDSDFGKNNKKDNSDLKKNEPERFRNDENRIPTPDTVSSGHTDDSNKVVNSENKLSKEPYEKISESNNPKGKKPLSLKQRRKSMPVLSKQVTFSSDEEYEAECSDNGKRERPPREDKTRKYFDRHKLIHKVSETSGIDEKYSSCHESSRETFKMNRFNDKYRIPRDKSRNRRHFSPENNRRVTRDYQEDDRDEGFRHNRVLVSPPRESFDSARHFRDRRPNYDRDEGRRSRRDQFKPDRYPQREDQEGRHSQEDTDDYPERTRRTRYGVHEERSKKRSNSHDERFRQKEVYEIEKQRAAFERQNRVQRDTSQEDQNRHRYPAHEGNLTQIEVYQEERLEMRIERVDTFDLRDKLNNQRIGDEEVQKIDTKGKKRRKRRSKSREDRNRHVKPTMNTVVSDCEAISDCDEPSNKRARTDSSNKPFGEVKALQQPTGEGQQLPAKTPTEEVKTLKDQTIVDDPLIRARNLIEEVIKPIAPPEVIKPKAPSSVEDRLLPEFAKHMQPNSCQSPDNPPLEAPPTTPTSNKPKEIMNTAATYLEDPRITSKKYRKGIEGDKVVITTATGRNVELIPIDISTWDIPRVDVPQALRNPVQITDEMVHDIYADIENPNSNSSMISEEAESSDLRMADYLSRNFHMEYETERIKQIEARADKQVENVEHKRDTTNGQQKVDVGNKDVVVNPEERKLPPVKYKISRVSNVEAKKDTPPLTLGALFQQFQTVVAAVATDVITTAKPSEPKPKVDELSTDNDTQDNTAKAQEQKPSESRHLRRRKMSAKELVEGDLALSDETMDNVVQKQTKKEKVKEKPLSKSENQKIAETEKETAKPVKTVTEKKTRKSKNEKDSNQKKEENCTEKQPDEKSTRKTRKKAVTKHAVTSTNETEKSKDMEKKATKTKSSKGKFPELFGDSSSLITPEDLGIAEAPTDKYVPIFEDAQDAVYVNVHALRTTELETTEPPVTSSMTDESANEGKEKPKSIICKISLPLPDKNVENDSIHVSVSKQLPQKSKNENDAALAIQTEKDNSAVTKITHLNKNSENIDTAPISNQKEMPNSNKQENTDSTPVCVKKITPNMEVSNAVETKEPEVVTTVVISSGVQPEIEEPQTNKLADKIETIALTSATKITEAIPIALATSTPHKRLLLQLEAEVQSSSCNSSELHKDDSSRDDRSTLSNGVSTEDQNDDVPDVRIFVRRRRRARKV